MVAETSNPPTGGPSALAVHVVDSSRPLTFARSPSRTRAFTNGFLAAFDTIVAAVCTTATTHN